MPETLELPDGRMVTVGARTTGGSKNQTRYGLLAGRSVVIKIQATHGRLPQEEIALKYASSFGLPVPQVITGWTLEGGYCLILSREPGRRTHEPGGWYRMGRDLARLATVPTGGCPLDHFDGAAYAADHLERLATVTPLINGWSAEVRRAIQQLTATRRPTLTHGDPGSGNYLDHESGGTILDWETACVAPFGIDIGRAAFIALLDNDRTNNAAQLHAAVIRGYRSGLGLDHGLDDTIVSAATIVAGLQFIHGRHTRPLRPDRTARQAVDTLISFLDRRAGRTESTTP